MIKQFSFKSSRAMRYAACAYYFTLCLYATDAFSNSSAGLEEFDLRTLSTLQNQGTPVSATTTNVSQFTGQALASDQLQLQSREHRSKRSKIKIFNTETGEFISKRGLVRSIDAQATVVLGEFHYNENIQNAEATLIGLLSNDTMPIAWEFLEFPDQTLHSKIFDLYTENRIRTSAVTDLQFPFQANGTSATYNPVMRAIKKEGNTIIATNAPRPVKAQLMDFGYETLAPDFQPPQFSLDNASDDYFERFFNALGGGLHPLPRPIEAYFAAQFYTDEVLAWKAQDARILIVGSFHSDFNDGVVDRVPAYSSRPVTSIKVIDAEAHLESEIEEFLEGSPEYGAYADFVVIACGDTGC